MKKRPFARVACAAGLALALAGSLAGCASEPAELPEGAAATVNGVAIAEDQVTREVQAIRAYMEIEGEDAWGTWLVESGYTPELVRSETINGLIRDEVARQSAEAEGIAVSDEEVAAFIEYEKSMAGGQEAWLEYIASGGYDEQSYSTYVKDSLTYQYLLQAVAGDVAATDEEILAYGPMVAGTYEGAKRSSHILFAADDEAAAESVLSQIQDGALSFADAAAQHSSDEATAGTGGDMGWNCDAELEEAYLEALASLGEGEVSGLVRTSAGIHIIMCTDVYAAPEEFTSVDQLPAGTAELIASLLKSSLQEAAYEEWLAAQVEAADVAKAGMPEGLPYDIDLAPYEQAAEEAQAEGLENAQQIAES